jgi:hypothetical protein
MRTIFSSSTAKKPLIIPQNLNFQGAGKARIGYQGFYTIAVVLLAMVFVS